MILPVLNGLRHKDILAERFNPLNVVGCALKVVTVLEAFSWPISALRLQVELWIDADYGH